MTRILIADDHDVVRSGVRAILEGHEGWEVVGEARDGKEAIDRALATRPDVVVLDYALPLVNGVEATRQIRQAPDAPVVILLSTYDEDEFDRSGCGAAAYVSKASFSPDRLQEAWSAAASAH